MRSDFQPLRDSNPSDKLIKAAADDDYGQNEKDISDFDKVDLTKRNYSRGHTGVISSARGASHR